VGIYFLAEQPAEYPKGAESAGYAGVDDGAERDWYGERGRDEHEPWYVDDWELAANPLMLFMMIDQFKNGAKPIGSGFGFPGG
jgi:hypothetical protein